MSKDKIFHKENRVYWIKGSDLPKSPDPVFCDVPSREATEEEIERSGFKNRWPEYRVALAVALSTKGVEVTNAFFAIRLVLNHAGIALPESDETLFKDTERYFRNNALYDLPDSFEVKIERMCSNCQSKQFEKCASNDFRINGGCNAELLCATIVPKQPEPVKEEDQDQLWDEIDKKALECLTPNGILNYIKANFTLTRKQ